MKFFIGNNFAFLSNYSAKFLLFQRKTIVWKKKISIFLLHKKKLAHRKFYLTFDVQFSSRLSSRKQFILRSNSIFDIQTILKFRKTVINLWKLSIGMFFIMLGFFSATSAITIIGSVADWDPLAAAVMLCWTELLTKIYYNNNHKLFIFKLLNSFKIGVTFGMFVDAFKLTS